MDNYHQKNNKYLNSKETNQIVLVWVHLMQLSCKLFNKKQACFASDIWILCLISLTLKKEYKTDIFCIRFVNTMLTLHLQKHIYCTVSYTKHWHVIVLLLTDMLFNQTRDVFKNCEKKERTQKSMSIHRTVSRHFRKKNVFFFFIF